MKTKEALSLWLILVVAGITAYYISRFFEAGQFVKGLSVGITQGCVALFYVMKKSR